MANKQSENLWDKAIETLSDEHKQQIVFGCSDKRAILGDVLAAVEAKKHLCMKRRWKYKKSSGEDVILRDLFEKMTKWVVKFKEIGDVAVQYDPGHAALPWAGVRFILQMTVNEIQTFGAMVEGVELVSNLITRYAIFENLYLYETSTVKEQLTESVIRLYATILLYLSKASRYYDRKTSERFARSIIQTADMSVDAYLRKISEQEAEVDTLAHIVDAEYQRNMAAHQLSLSDELEDLSHGVQALQLDVTDTRHKLGQILCTLEEPIVRIADQLSDIHDNLQRMDRLEIFRWMSTIPYRIHHQTSARDLLRNTGLWLLQKKEFVDWRRSSVSAILWLHGIPGSGKTKLVATVIENILKETIATPSAAPIAYFYCARSAAEPERAEPEEILRSILKQLSCSKPELPIREPVAEEYKKRKKEAEEHGSEPLKLTVTECIELILALTHYNPAIIVIDALDECQQDRRHELLEALDDIIKKSANLVKIFVSSRDDIDIVLRLEESPNVFINASDNGEDIERFVYSEVERSITRKRLLNGQVSDELKNRIIATLIGGASGMFRWVSLQIQNLCDSRRMKIEKDIRKELGQLPRTLAELYTLTYEQIVQTETHGRLIAMRTLKWLLCAQRSLSPAELVAAVSVSSEGEHTALSNADILNLCCNLVVLDSDLDTFRFAHLSVREYLECRPDYTKNETNALAVERCLEVYLYNQKILHTAESIAEHHNLLRKFATLYWIVHYLSVDEERRRSGLKSKIKSFLFKGSDIHTSFDEWTQATEETSRSLSWDDPLRCRLGTVCSIPSTPLFTACTFGLLEILEEPNIVENKNWNQRNNEGSTALMLAAREGHEAVVQLLLAYGGVDVNSKDQFGRTALSRAARGGHEAAVRLLLAQRGVDVDSKDHDCQTALWQAARWGYEAVVRLLLAHGGVDVDSKNRDGQTALWQAACHGHEAVVRLLLAHGGVDVDSKDKNSQTALWQAAYYGHEAVVRLLLEREDVDPDTKGGWNGWTPLGQAVGNRHEAVVQLLLECEGVNVNSKNKYGQTPLWKAAHDGNEAVVRLLLEREDVEPDTDGNDFGQTPLCCAAGKGHEAVVRLLLARKDVNMESKDKKFDQTPLSHAAENGYEAVVRLLLEREGVGVDPKDKKYDQAPLWWAAGNGHETVVRLLLERKGVDLNSKHKYGQTALSHAAEKGHEAVVRLLLEHEGIDVNSKDKYRYGQTALSCAAENGHEEVVRLLLAHESVNVDSKDKYKCGQTPLSHAAENGHEAVVRLLLAHERVNVDSKDKNGQTALWWAAKNGHEAVMRLLTPITS